MSENPGLHLYTSNRLEVLADGLAGLFAAPLHDPLRPELVIVPSLGMERWLTQQLATRQGICANIAFLFPHRFVSTIFEDTLPGRAAARFFARENLTWLIMKTLPPLLERREFAELVRYLNQSQPELRLYQLAGRIAATFDQYLAYRPRMILDWEKKKAEKNWQAILWRELIRSAPGLHPPALAEEFRESLGKGDVRLPERISLFGLSSLPEFYVQFLQELAARVSVHLFVLRPTPEWWSDIRSEREETRARRKVPVSAQLDLQFARGNPLLASLGKLGREFLEIVTGLDPTHENAAFRAPEGETILAQIHRDIFALHDPSGSTKRAVVRDDTSVQFHSCHSEMREMEVLHDQLLALFEQLPDLKPHEIVVMAPDITKYAPFIGAVFGTGPEELRIPFSIADRGTRAENGVIDTFLRILESAGGRFTASSVMGILESVPLQRNFEHAEPDLEIIRMWIEKTGIRWGIDAAQRAELGLPEYGENSWRAGLDRLLLGYAAPAHHKQLFAGILAYDEVEGNMAETLGHFADFADSLFGTARALQHPRTLGEWVETLHEVSVRFFAADDEREPELRQLRRVIEALGETATLSGFNEPISLDVLLAHLEQSLKLAEANSGFLAGRVTFCALKPMRAVPFRVVCLVGMNDTAYPRHDRPPAFDLIAQDPRPGDLSTRNDDRYLFLEALLSARDVFLVSYVGQSSRDNNQLPPSVLVSELLEYAEANFATETPLVRRHRLQPFSPSYFQDGTGLFSYSMENCVASEVAMADRAAPPPFVTAPISEPEADWCQVNLTQLIRFYGNPAKFFVEERLAIKIPRLDELLEDSEPLEVGGLPKYHLQQALLTHALRGEPIEPLLPVFRAKGDLPPGQAGAAQLREVCEAAEKFAHLVRQYVAAAPDEPRQVQLRLAQFDFRARLDNFYGGRLVHYRLTTRKPKDLLTAWLNHLVANHETPTESILITADKKTQPVLERFEPVGKEAARQHLGQLLEFYWRGLRVPLPLFPRSSEAFVEQTLRPKGKRSAVEVAQAKWRRSPEPWEPDKGEKPEADDTFLHFAFRNLAAPFDEPWQALALAVFAPPLKALRK